MLIINLMIDKVSQFLYTFLNKNLSFVQMGRNESVLRTILYQKISNNSRVLPYNLLVLMN